MRCTIYNGHPKYRMSGLRSLAKSLERYVPIRYDALSFAFLTEAALCALHVRFLDDANPTDVITFPALESDEVRMGEICISVDEALKYEKVQCLSDELTLYAVHGWLHLAGYDDHTDSDRALMREMERKTLDFLSAQSTPRIRVQKIRYD